MHHRLVIYKPFNNIERDYKYRSAYILFSSAINGFETINLFQIQNCRVDLCQVTNQREEHNKPWIILTCSYSFLYQKNELTKNEERIESIGVKKGSLHPLNLVNLITRSYFNQYCWENYNQDFSRGKPP